MRQLFFIVKMTIYRYNVSYEGQLTLRRSDKWRIDMKTVAPVKKGDLIEIEITGLGSSGEGVGKYEGFTVFVPGALPQETVEASVSLVKKSYATAGLSKVLMASKDRTEPLCPIYKECGGCQLQHLSYAGQLEVKRQQVQAALTRIGHLDIEALPTLGCVNSWQYRNKMQFPASLNAAGKLDIGCYALSTHSVIDTPNCLIQKGANNQVLATVRAWMEKYQISAYDEKTGKGIVRHVMSRVGVHSGEIMAVLVVSVYELPKRQELCTMLREAVPGLVSIIQNINKKPTNIIMGLKNKVLWGKATIKDSLGALSFNISALSFFQVNSEQAEVLYDKALEYAALTGKETVVDVYCGTGTISLYMARQAKKVYGIEIVAPAIDDAKINAQENGLKNAEFICGDAAVELPKLLKTGVQPDVIMVDPPRAGCEEKVLAAMVSVVPERIVYVSCNPASLARDLAYLEANGYKTQQVQPVDMFPQTHHVECVCLLSKKDVKHNDYVKIVLDTEDYYRIKGSHT